MNKRLIATAVGFIAFVVLASILIVASWLAEERSSTRRSIIKGRLAGIYHAIRTYESLHGSIRPLRDQITPIPWRTLCAGIPAYSSAPGYNEEETPLWLVVDDISRVTGKTQFAMIQLDGIHTDCSWVIIARPEAEIEWTDADAWTLGDLRHWIANDNGDGMQFVNSNGVLGAIKDNRVEIVIDVSEYEPATVLPSAISVNTNRFHDKGL